MEPTSLLLQCQSWEDFDRFVRPLSTKLKGDCFELLTREYLLLDARYNLRSLWSTHGDVPKAILERLNLFGRDVTGIDFVAETRSGKFWAIQCKFHQDERSLTREEATGLIAGRNRAPGQFELGLICTTANGRSAHLADEPDIEYLMGDVWRGLDAEFFGRLHAHLKGAEPPPPSLKHPRPHQLAALDRVHRYFAGERRGQVVMPCATGKSLLGFWCAEQQQARSVLVAVPNLSLVRQLLKDWTEQSLARGCRPRWVIVCSDESVAEKNAARDLGVKVDTDPIEIASWLRANRDADLSVVFTTYQSGKVLAAAAQQAGVTFDFGVFDEAHRTAGRQGAPFAHLLSDASVAIGKRVFMTATPRIYGGTKREDIVSMDDVALYGGEAFRMTFLEAMEQGIIPNLAIVAVAVSGKEIEQLLQDRRFVRLQTENEDTVVRVEDLVSALALRKAMQKYGIRRTLGFYGSRRRCRFAGKVQQLIGEIFAEYGPLDIFHVDGEMTAGERDAELRDFERSEHALLTNVRVFVEGVDCPAMDAVIFADPRQSVIDIVQGVGRALRPGLGKEAGYAIIPITIQDDGTPSDRAFAEVVRVTCALGSESELVLDYFTAIAQGKPWTGRRVFEVLDVDTGVSVDLHEVNQAIAVRTYERITWRVTTDDAHAMAMERGFEFLSETFSSVHAKYRWRCSKGHEWEATYNAIQQGSGCRRCAGLFPKALEDAHTLARHRGFEFLSQVFAGVRRKYRWRCSKGHEWEAIYGHIRRGSNCPHCAGTVPKTIEDAHALAKERGFEFISQEFTGVDRKYGWRCRESHEWEASYNGIQQGSGCPYCAGKARKGIEDARALAKKRGFDFLSDELAGSKRKYRGRCSHGHEWEAAYDSIQQGRGCPYCAGKARRWIEDAHALAKERGFNFLSEAFAGTGTKYRWRCSKGHEWEAIYGNIRKGSNCPHCAGTVPKTIVDAHALAKERGFEFISQEFTGVDRKYGWRCRESHEWEASYNGIQQGRGCPYCAGRVPRTIEDAHALAKERGFKFLSEAFAGTGTKYRWACLRGHEWEAKYNSIQQGTGCPHCARNVPKTVEDAHILAKERGFEFLSDAFAGTGTKYRWRCSKGHEWEAPYGSIQQGHGCWYCAGNATKTIEDAHALATERGFRFLSDELAGANREYLWRCSRGHEWEAKYNSIQQGHGCPYCAGKATKTIEDAHILAKERGFEFLSDAFAGTGIKYRWRCPKGHEWEAKYNNVQQGSGCPSCAAVRRGGKGGRGARPSRP